MFLLRFTFFLGVGFCFSNLSLTNSVVHLFDLALPSSSSSEAILTEKLILVYCANTGQENSHRASILLINDEFWEVERH
jgi:hypothetical protein